MKRLLIIGFGDIAHRTAAKLPQGLELRTVSRSDGFDLDRPETLRSLKGWADAILHCVPPPAAGTADPRTEALLAALETGGILPSRLVYISTSGVYGDCSGALVDEMRPLNPQSPRAVRRVDAETRLMRWGELHDIAVTVLRAPGIYAADRLPLERLAQGIPVLAEDEDVYTNHIHADDLATIALAALTPGTPSGIYNASDDTHLKMGAWFDLVADRTGFKRPERVSRSEAAARIPASMLSFMRESRRLDNTKLKTLLGVRLRYPTVYEGVPARRLAA
jgi:nucleoside-diphosphate-sugar epimerase